MEGQGVHPDATLFVFVKEKDRRIDIDRPDLSRRVSLSILDKMATLKNIKDLVLDILDLEPVHTYEFVISGSSDEVSLPEDQTFQSLGFSTRIRTQIRVVNDTA